MTALDAALPPLIRALLRDTACYGHKVDPVRLIETHISWVLLTGEYAYKIKKPVDMGFLDFSTLALRQQACNDEVRLNRRLAAGIYLGVAAITGSAEAPRLGEITGFPLPNPLPLAGEGANESLRDSPVNIAFEYAVKMRQFPPDATLDLLSERGELGFVQIDALAARLARFHLGECAAASADSPWGEPDTIWHPVMENFHLLSDRLTAPEHRQLLTKLQDWSLDEHQRLAPLMRGRKRAGRVRECHGDLHLGNLAWVDGQLVIFDCIEFSPALRWIDVVSEVAFCFMDLLHRQHCDLAFRFLNAWLESTGDYAGLALLRYYAVYRAMVRAKVAALRAQQSAGGDAGVTEWLELAGQLMQTPPPELWITHGLSGSGKTTASQQLLQQRGLIRLRSDVERKRLAGLDAQARSGSGVAEGLYAEDASRRTYAHLAGLADGLLDAGWPVIADAAFLMRWQRELFRESARRHGLHLQILDMQADPATLRERIVRRIAAGRDASEADLKVLQHQLDTAEPLGADEPGITPRILYMNPLV